MGGPLPAMFGELESVDTGAAQDASGSSILDVLAATPETGRAALISERVLEVVADVFDCGVADIDTGAMLDDIGLDSMMAMEFRVRINVTFSIDVPVLEILRGVSVNSLSDRILTELEAIHGDAPGSDESAADDQPDVDDDDVDVLLDDLSESELRALLAEIEADGAQPDAGRLQS